MLDDVARRAGYSRNPFLRAFRDAYGETPRAYLTRRRIEQAKDLGGGVWATDDCKTTFDELSARGVEFLQEPAERPYGIEAVSRDVSGNWFSLTQRTEV